MPAMAAIQKFNADIVIGEAFAKNYANAWLAQKVVHT